MLGYLMTTRAVGLMLANSQLQGGGMEGIHVFTEACFAPPGSASHGGSVMFVEGVLISRKPRRQSSVTISTAES